MDYKIYKDSTPERTVETIRGILSRLGVSMSGEIQCPSPGLYALRLADEQNVWAVNGKGLTSEYCLASAYGEAIERLQARIAHGRQALDIDDRYAFSLYPDEVMLPVPGIRDNAQSVYRDMLLAWRGKAPTDEQMNRLWERLLGGGKTAYAPYYDVSADRVALLPDRVILALSGSNGLSAGNTPEEALCQAMAEVFERYVQQTIVKNALTPPVIPGAWLAENCPMLYNVMRRLEKRTGYTIRVMDASLGRGCPVVCIALIDRASQRYCLRFGAHPVIATALERCLTELCQGYTPGIKRMDDAYLLNWPGDGSVKHDDEGNLYDMMKACMGRVADRFFSSAPDWRFEPWRVYERFTNKEGVRRMAKRLADMAGNVYARDYGYVGFPAFRVYVPGMSRMPVLHWDEQTLKEQDMLGKLFSLPGIQQEISSGDRSALIDFLSDSSTYSVHDIRYSDSLPMNVNAVHAALRCDAGDVSGAADILERLQNVDMKYLAAARDLRMRDRAEAERDGLIDAFFGRDILSYVKLVWRSGSALVHLMSPFRPKKRGGGSMAQLYDAMRAEMAKTRINQLEMRRVFRED